MDLTRRQWGKGRNKLALTFPLLSHVILFFGIIKYLQRRTPVSCQQYKPSCQNFIFIHFSPAIFPFSTKFQSIQLLKFSFSGDSTSSLLWVWGKGTLVGVVSVLHTVFLPSVFSTVTYPCLPWYQCTLLIYDHLQDSCGIKLVSITLSADTPFIASFILLNLISIIQKCVKISLPLFSSLSCIFLILLSF